MSLFVVGGTGTIGALVVQRLAALGRSVHLATRDPSRVHGLAAGVRAVAFRIERARAADFEGSEAVLLAVPRGVVLSRDEEASLLDALGSAKVARVVLVTGLGVERAIGTPLQRLEVSLRESGLRHVIVRPTFLFQSFCAGALHEGIVRRSEIAAAAGDARISFVDARDVAEVAAAGLVEAGLVEDAGSGLAFDLTGPAAVRHDEIASSIGRATRREIRYRSLSDDEARAALLATGVPNAVVDARLSFLALARRGAFASVTDSVARVLGRAPRTLDVFADDHASTWQEILP